MATSFREASDKPISWFRNQSRKYLLGFLAWNDRHGAYRDEDLEEGMEPLTKAEALDLVKMALEEGEVAAVYRDGRRNPHNRRIGTRRSFTQQHGYIVYALLDGQATYRYWHPVKEKWMRDYTPAMQMGEVQAKAMKNRFRSLGILAYLDRYFPQHQNPKKRKARKSNPTRSNPQYEGMLMGRLVSLEVLVNGSRKTIRPSGRFLGYLPGNKTLCVLKKTSKAAPDSVASRVDKLHRRFHNCGPTKVTMWEWPDKKGRLKDVGRIVALTYSIPQGLRSPDKAKYLWHHEFGDHGERGHGPVRGSGNYPQKYMPTLQEDRAGNLYIKRMPGNKFYVTDWLYW